MKVFEEYIANSFSGLPGTEELRSIKQDMLANMEEKYDSLLLVGLSPHEAIGSVIVDFGDVDELLIELGYKSVHSPSSPDNIDFMPFERIREYITVTRHSAVMIGFGVSWIIIGVALVVLIEELSWFSGIFEDFPGIVILVFVAMSVAAFIYSGTRLTGFDEFDAPFLIKSDTKQAVDHEYSRLQKGYTQQIIFSIVLLIVSPVIILVAENIQSVFLNQISVSLFLMFVSLAVFILIVTGMSSSAYTTVLENGKSISAFYQVESSQQEKSSITTKLTSIMWVLVPAIYLGWSFLTGDWHITWIIFPITGVIQTVISILMGETEH